MLDSLKDGSSVPASSNSRAGREIVSAAVALLCGIAFSGTALTGDDRIDDIMYQDPAFPALTTRSEFPEESRRLWLQALARPEAELQRLAADTIAFAHRAGMKGLDEAAGPLVAVFQQGQLEVTVRRAVANALVTLDAQQAAPAFAERVATESLTIAAVIEPALAHWDYEPVRSIWRERLADPETERARLQLAIECLGSVKDADAQAALLQFVKDENAERPLRIAAARASASIGGGELLAMAHELADVKRDQPTASLLAATLLTGRSDSEAVALLQELAMMDSVTVSHLALRRLFEIDPVHVDGLTAFAILSSDVNVRRVGCEALVHQNAADAIIQLAPMLDDANPGLRHFVSQSLIQLAQRESLRDAVIQSTADVVSLDAWRGLEQGTIVLASIDHKPAATRLLELLLHRRPEVRVAAAWGLRKLAVSDTLPAMLAHAQQQAQHIFDRTAEIRYVPAIDLQLSQLFQAFGELGYGEAEPLLRRFIPKTHLYAGAARPAAVWATGKLNEGTVDEALAKLLAERLSDVFSTEPEMDSVRRMSAIGIGRMKAESQLPALRQFVDEGPSDPGLACAWAIERITGETRTFKFERVIGAADWFLTLRRGNRTTEMD